MSKSSNHTKTFVQCCHGKHTVASSRTLLFYHVYCSWLVMDEKKSRLKDKYAILYL